LYYFVLFGLQPEPEPEAAAAVCYHHQCPHVRVGLCGIYMNALLINRSFLVVALNFVLATLSSLVVSVYNKTPPQRRSHSRVFTPPSLARGGGGAQFCYPWGPAADLAEGRGVVWRCSVPILGLPSGDAFWPITPTDPLFTATEPLAQATEGGFGPKCIIGCSHWYSSLAACPSTDLLTIGRQ
jgi:hypothetical protein